MSRGYVEGIRVHTVHLSGRVYAGSYIIRTYVWIMKTGFVVMDAFEGVLGV